MPLYKGIGDKGECSNYRVIDLLSVPVKLYRRAVTDRVKASTEYHIEEEKCCFRSRMCGSGVSFKECVLEILWEMDVFLCSIYGSGESICWGW